MSDTFVDATVDGPADGGQAPEVDGSEFGTEVETFDYTPFADKHVLLKVDGEEVKVPLSEALAGYQRQADYTRKTQELASQRDQVQWASAIKDALERDPKGTIDLLSTHYGISRAEAQRQVEAGSFGGDADDDWQDPGDQRWREMDSRIAKFEEEQASQRLQSEISRLQTTYGDEFNPREVVAEAMRIGATDLEAVFKQVHFDRVFQQRQSAANASALEAARIAAKRDAGVVSGGSSALGSNEVVGEVRTIADAYELAKKQLGA